MLEAVELDEVVRLEHERWMKEAIQEALLAQEKSEVPIGAIIVKDGRIIARGHNVREIERDALGHAELRVIQEANKELDAWRLEGTTMYVTLEPCPMCAGALINSRVERVVYGASDYKAGCAGTLMNLLEKPQFNHQTETIRGVLAEECGQLLTGFFKNLREQKEKSNLPTGRCG
ncbi:tRNA adenosine(34) deaminase TadA [Aerococcaceae bacterium WGS1372]